jgi:hypothetical protein
VILKSKEACAQKKITKRLNTAEREIEKRGLGKRATKSAEAQGNKSTPRNRRFNPIYFV